MQSTRISGCIRGTALRVGHVGQPLRACLFVLPLLWAACGFGDVSPGKEEPIVELELGGPGQGNPAMTSSQGPPFVEIIAQTFTLQSFESSLVATRALEDLSSPPYTVFPPWDVALSELPYWDKITENRQWYGHLRDLVLGHFHEGGLAKDELRHGDTVAMANGDVSEVSAQNTRPRLDDILVLASADASDGYVHMLDEVREPKWAERTILDVIGSDERFSVLSEALTRPAMAQMRATLSTATAALTLFAATDEALAGLNLDECEEPRCSTLLAGLLGGHVVEEVVSTDFSPDRDFATESGSFLAWNSSTQTITCTDAGNPARETHLDRNDELFAINGIVHPIRGPLCAPTEQCATECDAAMQCGAADDGCGGTINCGYCGAGQNCEDNLCVDEDTNIAELFKQSAYGAHEVLVFNVRCVSGNCQEHKTQKMWENLSSADVEDAFFGAQRYSAHSWYRACSNDQFRFVPSQYGGVIDVELDASDVENGDGAARRQFNETFGLYPGDAVEHVVYCFPKHNRGPNITIAPVYNGLPAGSTVWLSHGHCVDAGFILHELGHSIGLKHAAGFQENGTIGSYSDNTDIMGGALTGPQCFNGTNLWRTGWHVDKSISLAPAERGSLDVTLATMLDRTIARDDEFIVVKLGDYYLRYNVRQLNELPGAQQSQPDVEMDRLVTITKDEAPIRSVRSVLYAGIDVGSTYAIEGFNGDATLYIKGCHRSDGDDSQARTMTVSVGYDEASLCDGQCVDSDGDGVSDCEDRCPKDANKAERGLCGCGVSDVDTDGDERPDCMDRCPNDASKVHPLQCGCGVAEGSCGLCEDSNPTWCEGTVVERGFCFGEGSNPDYVQRRCCKTCFIDLKDQW